MLNRIASETDYLAIGHITRDLLHGGRSAWGGTAAYAALTARRLGLRASVLTVFNPEADLAQLNGIPIAGAPSDRCTTFENTDTGSGRVQRVTHQAGKIHPHMLPEIWRTAPIVHFGPVIDEIDPDLLRLFETSFRLLTPQGWMRSVDRDGWVRQAEWVEAAYMLGQADAAVFSLEDAGGDERLIDAMAAASNILVVTEGAVGCRVYAEGQLTKVPTETAAVVDATGAGDVFAAGFAVHLHRSGDPIESARFGAKLAAYSVTRFNLDGVPTIEECREAAGTFSPARII